MFAVVLVTSLKHALNLRHKECNRLKIMKGIGEFVILRVRIYSSSPTDALGFWIQPCYEVYAELTMSSE